MLEELGVCHNLTDQAAEFEELELKMSWLSITDRLGWVCSSATRSDVTGSWSTPVHPSITLRSQDNLSYCFMIAQRQYAS